MKIAHLLAPGAYGGLETVVESLAIGQRRRGHEVTVLSILPPDHPDPPFHSRLEAESIDLVRIPNPGRRYLRERRLVRTALRGVVPDVAHTHGSTVHVVDGTAAAGAGIPTVGTVHGLDPSDPRDRLYHRLECLAFRWRFDAVIAVSDVLATSLASQGVPTERIHRIQNAILAPEPVDRPEARQRLNIPDDAVNVGWIGRMVSVKGLDLLIDAAERLRNLPLRWTLVGDGPERAALEALARERGVEDRVHFTGPIPSAGTLMKGFDLFAMASHAEGTPMVLLEAIAAGVPIVSTAVGGIPTLVTPDEAVLVEPGSAESLAEGVERVVNDPEGAARRAARAKARISASFSLDSWLDRHDEVYAAARERRIR